MKTLLLATPTSNIGNSFISKGALACLSNAFPDSDIFEVSLYPDYAAERCFTRRGLISSQIRRGGDDRASNHFRDQTINPSELFDADLAVIPGCVMGKVAFERYLETLKRIDEKDIPILFLGVGAGSYDSNIINKTQERIQELQNIAFVSRDETCYDAFADLADTSHSGIDCAWFLDDWYTGPEANQSLTALTFDKISEPDIDVTGRVIRPNHGPYRQFQQSLVERVGELLGVGQSLPRNHFVSDSATDYLSIYSNAAQTHSDRIHACVPALVFDNEAQFYYETPRSKLFDRVGLSDITNKPVSLNQEILDKQKQAQVEFLSELKQSGFV